MPFITREDGEHFVIPSYRDVISAKNKNLLKRDIVLLSQSYGEYITMQRKGANQYEVAFSPDTGYLLGESIWQYFKRPVDMIYCEAIPNTNEAILVIVKGESVYLDGRFPTDSIPEELVIFLTQQNSFDIYIYGDVPISQTPDEGKFSFEANSVRNFTRLDQPVFANLPLYKNYQLQLVDQVLRSHGIGVFPVKQVVLTVVVLAGLWFLYSWFSKEDQVIQPIVFHQANPYLNFNTALMTPAPDQEINQILGNLRLLTTMPGWVPFRIDYTKGTMIVGVRSGGGRIEDLLAWAANNGVRIDITTEGFDVTMGVPVSNRPLPKRIYPIRDVVARFVDNLNDVYPGNHIRLGVLTNKGDYTEVSFSLNLDGITPLVLALIGQQLRDLPFVLQKMSLNVENGNLSGTITLDALGGPT